ncbi:MAG: substrate-binding domain-containing protein [Acidobacteria bacterium]|nr:substrate-binding domain-containing protein [Acidobacteriota bacterium]
MVNGRLSNAFPGLLVVTAFAFAGCGGPGGDAPGDEAGARPQIALVMKSLANEFFETMAEGARAHHEANAGAYDLVVNGIRNESDLAQQVALVEQMVASGSDAIVIAPADSKALAPALARAQAAGVVVVNIDNRLDLEVAAEAGLDAPFVGPDNRDGARRVGEVLAERLAPGDRVAIVGGIPTAFNAQQRRAGFEDAMNAAGAEIVGVQSGGWEQAQANTVAAAMLREHPALRALLCANDNMALGALAARRQSGRDDVLIVGFDNIDAVAALVAQGEILATADQHADRLAVFGIEAALEILSGGEAGDRQTPVDVVTAPD